MKNSDFADAIRATTIPLVSLILKLVDVGVLTKAEAMEIVDVSCSDDVTGPGSRASQDALHRMTTTLETNFKLRPT